MDKYSVIQCNDRKRFDRNLNEIPGGQELAPFAFPREACQAAARLADLHSRGFEVWRIRPDGEAQIAVYAPAQTPDTIE